MTTEGRALVVFARLPVPGKVKTRLAATVGKDLACAFYKDCAEHVIREASKTDRARLHVFYSDSSEHDSVITWLTALGINNYEIQHQIQKEDLGARIYSALSLVLQGDIKKAIVVGTDIPDISSTLLSQAYNALDQHEGVVGPAVDGGYYLLGVRKVEKELFEGIKWSTPEVLPETMKNVERLGMSFAPIDTLPVLQDIDTHKDLESWMTACNEEHAVLPIARKLASAVDG